MTSKLEKKLLHQVSTAIGDYGMIHPGERLMVCLSGGKDSYTMLNLLLKLRVKWGYSFDVFAFILDQAQPGWDDRGLRDYLTTKRVPFEILNRDTYSVVTEKIPAGKTYCSLCSRLRRGHIYTYAKTHGFRKIALGHHRDDLLESILMSMLYSGEMATMPPKLITNDKRHIVIRPLVYCHEDDICAYAEEQAFPIIPCQLCGSQDNLTRKKMKKLLATLTAENPKVPGNLFHALSHVRASQLLDEEHYDFKGLEAHLVEDTTTALAQ